MPAPKGSHLMLTHPDSDDLWLLAPDDLASGTPEWLAPGVADRACEILEWARDYLSEPHPELGRPGPVCPYVSASLRSSCFYVTVRRGRVRRREIASVVARYRDWFAELEPRG